jgi:hypothetical protein
MSSPLGRQGGKGGGKKNRHCIAKDARPIESVRPSTNFGMIGVNG